MDINGYQWMDTNGKSMDTNNYMVNVIVDSGYGDWWIAVVKWLITIVTTSGYLTNFGYSHYIGG